MWLYVTSEEEMKNFLQDNLTDQEIKNGVSVNEQYERIMEIYENSDIIE